MKKCRICEESIPDGVTHDHPLDCLKFVQAKNRALAPAPKPLIRVPDPDELPLGEDITPRIMGEIRAMPTSSLLPVIAGAALVCLAALALGIGPGSLSRRARKGHP